MYFQNDMIHLFFRQKEAIKSKSVNFKFKYNKNNISNLFTDLEQIENINLITFLFYFDEL